MIGENQEAPDPPAHSPPFDIIYNARHAKIVRTRKASTSSAQWTEKTKHHPRKTRKMTLQIEWQHVKEHQGPNDKEPALSERCRWNISQQGEPIFNGETLEWFGLQGGKAEKEGDSAMDLEKGIPGGIQEKDLDSDFDLSGKGSHFMNDL